MMIKSMNGNTMKCIHACMTKMNYRMLGKNLTNELPMQCVEGIKAFNIA